MSIEEKKNIFLYFEKVDYKQSYHVYKQAYKDVNFLEIPDQNCHKRIQQKYTIELFRTNESEYFERHVGEGETKSMARLRAIWNFLNETKLEMPKSLRIRKESSKNKTLDSASLCQNNCLNSSNTSQIESISNEQQVNITNIPQDGPEELSEKKDDDIPRFSSGQTTEIAKKRRGGKRVQRWRKNYFKRLKALDETVGLNDFMKAELKRLERKFGNCASEQSIPDIE